MTFNPAIVFHGIYLKEVKTYVYPKTYTWMFRAALFLSAQIWKQPRCLLVDFQKDKLWYIKTREYYSVPERNELSHHG